MGDCAKFQSMINSLLLNLYNFHIFFTSPLYNVMLHLLHRRKETNNEKSSSHSPRRNRCARFVCGHWLHWLSFWIRSRHANNGQQRLNASGAPPVRSVGSTANAHASFRRTRPRRQSGIWTRWFPDEAIWFLFPIDIPPPDCGPGANRLARLLAVHTEWLATYQTDPAHGTANVLCPGRNRSGRIRTTPIE